MDERKKTHGAVIVVVSNVFQRPSAHAAEPARVIAQDAKPTEGVTIFRPISHRVSNVLSSVFAVHPLQTFAEPLERVDVGPLSRERKRVSRVQFHLQVIAPVLRLDVQLTRSLY